MRYSRAIKIAVMFFFAAFMAMPSFAATSSAKILVTATVLPYVNFNAAQNVSTYQVRSEDLQRGYVDLPGSITVNLKTNTQNGVHVMIENWGGGKVLVSESGTGIFTESQLTLNSAGYRPGTQISKRYDSRIMLPADAQEGTYPFDIAMMTSQ
jgi:hypothetical protein